jgi:uncharacterized membrane protein
MVIKTVIALCLFQMGVLIEHTVQSSFSECLENKRIMERNMKSTNRIVCGEVEAEIDIKIINGKEYEFIKSIQKKS